MERQLVAVAFADLVGFSELVERNDVSAVTLWARLRADLLEPKIEEYHGRLLRVVGDALFVRFRSVVESVTWAQAVVAAMQEVDFELPGADRPSMRVGINVEDAIVTQDDLHGEGINIAARIHALADPGEIVVTQAVHAYVHNKVDAGFVDMGEHRLHHVSYPVQLYKIALKAGDGQRGGLSQSPVPRFRPTLRNGPGVVVMPFRVLSADRSEDYFGEGITDDIVNALSQVRAFFVIARSTALALRSQSGAPAAVLAGLGVRYVLEGTVRRHAGLLRINAKLLDATDGSVLWSRAFDGRLDQLFEYQEQIAASVARAILPLIQRAEITRVRAKPTANLDAYDCLLKALSLLYTFDRAEFFESASYIDRALLLDPNYAQALAHKAWWYVLCFGEGKVDNLHRDVRLAATVAHRALELDPDDGYTLAVCGHVEGFLCSRHEVAISMFDRALAGNPHLAFAWGVSASTLSFMGEHDEALRRLEVVEKLSPNDSLQFFFSTVAGLACFVGNRLEEALDHLDKAYRANPRFVATHRLSAAVAALLGRAELVRQSRERLLEIEPRFDAEQFIAWYPLIRVDDRERLAKGLQAAGLR